MLEREFSNWQKIAEKFKDSPCLPSPPDPRDWPLSSIAEIPEKLPDKVDLSHHLPFVLDQQKCGICVAKSGVNALNAFTNSKESLPKRGLSSLFLYTRCKQEDGIPNQEGTYPRVSLKIMQKEGVCPAKLLPFEGKCKPLPILTEVMKSEAEKYKIKAYARLSGVEQIKQALAAGKLVMVGTIVTSENWLDDDEWILTPKGHLLGGHATLLCGYDDTLEYAGYEGFFKGVNSWSEAWGKEGFYYMAYDYATWESKDIPGFYALMEAWAVEMETLPSLTKETVILDQPMIIKNGRTLAPVRFITEVNGGQILDWNNNTKTVIFKTAEGKKVTMQVDNVKVKVEN